MNYTTVKNIVGLPASCDQGCALHEVLTLLVEAGLYKFPVDYEELSAEEEEARSSLQQLALCYKEVCLNQK